MLRARLCRELCHCESAGSFLSLPAPDGSDPDALGRKRQVVRAPPPLMAGCCQGGKEEELASSTCLASPARFDPREELHDLPVRMGNSVLVTQDELTALRRAEIAARHAF